MFRYANNSIPLVFDKEASEYKITNLSQIKPIPINQDCSIQESIEDELIVINTDCINKPLIIKISYHPGWQVQGAKKIYLVSPAFMLIYPEQDQVTLTYSGTKAKKLGVTLTILGLLIILFIIIKKNVIKNRVNNNSKKLRW